MCAGIAVNWRDLPDQLIEEFALENRVVSRNGAEKEIRFLFRDPMAQLPVWVGDQLTIVEWGNRNDKESRLPRTGWCRKESLEAGKWNWLQPQQIIIPACYGFEKGVWFQIREGIAGILVQDGSGLRHAYMITESASHYYEVMTRHERMPVLIGEVI